jgi:cytochrome c biogenesis protein
MANAPARQRKLPEPFHSLWEALNSLPIAIVVMLLLAILSALGTVIPQEHLARPAPGQTMEMMYFERFGVETYYTIPLGKAALNIPTSKHALIESLGLKHIYFTPYFFVLLVWLSVSAIVCNITRFKRTVRQWREPTVVRGPKFFGGDKRSLEVEGLGPNAAAAVEQSFRRQGYRVVKKDEDGATHIYADKGFLKRWALVLLHFSILVLIFGGCYGKIYGVESYVRMADGEEKDLTLNLHEGKLEMVHWLLDRVPPLTFHLDQDHFRIDYDKKIKLPAMLEEMLASGMLSEDRVEYERYFVKDFVSQLTVSREGRSKTQEVKVNHPIKLDKLVLYQSGYVQEGYLNVEIDGESREYRFVPNVWMALGPNGLVPAENAMSMGGSGQYSDHAFILMQVKAGDLYVGGEKQGYLGPMSIVEMADMTTGQQFAGRLISPDQGFETEIGGTPVSVTMSTRVDDYSDFSYKRDPGIPILYFGWIAMIVGVSLAMYIPFSQAWVRISGSDAHILLTGRGGREDAAKLASQWNDILSTP